MGASSWDEAGTACRSVLAFADSYEGGDIIRDLAAQAGCRLAGVLPIAAPAIGEAGLDGADACLVFADEETNPAALGVLLEELNWRAAQGGAAVIAEVPLPLLDLAAAKLGDRSSVLLSRASPAELVAALAMATRSAAARPALVSDISTERNALQLRRLSEDVERIARVLAALSSDRDAAAAPEIPEAAEGIESLLSPEEMLDLIRAVIRARRQRERFFEPELFADPAWDMLLDLMAARLERKRVAVSSLCIAAAVPATTALRHLKSMTDSGLFIRRPDPGDGRRVFIELSDRAANAMTRCLAEMSGMVQPV